MDKSPDAFRTIGEAAEELEVPQHVLRFWETRFSQIRPMKRGGGRRYYRPADMTLLRAIKAKLHGEGYTIKGVQRMLKEHGARALIAADLSPGPEQESQLAPVAPPPAPLVAPTTAPDQATLRGVLAQLAAARLILIEARQR